MLPLASALPTCGYLRVLPLSPRQFGKEMSRRLPRECKHTCVVTDVPDWNTTSFLLTFHLALPPIFSSPHLLISSSPPICPVTLHACIDPKLHLIPFLQPPEVASVSTECPLPTMQDASHPFQYLPTSMVSRTGQNSSPRHTTQRSQPSCSSPRLDMT